MSRARQTGPAAVKARPLPDVLAKAVAAAVQAVVAACQPDQIILFGSAARGRHHRGSDLDLLVVVDDDARCAECATVALIAVARLPFDVDVLVTSTTRLPVEAQTLGSVVRRAVREGTVVHLRGPR